MDLLPYALAGNPTVYVGLPVRLPVTEEGLRELEEWMGSLPETWHDRIVESASRISRDESFQQYVHACQLLEMEGTKGLGRREGLLGSPGRLIR